MQNEEKYFERTHKSGKFAQRKCLRNHLGGECGIDEISPQKNCDNSRGEEEELLF